MLTRYATGVLAVVGVAVIWAAVQAAWRRVFPGGEDPDALAGRMGCHGCTCTGVCERESAEDTILAGEEYR